ncbi:MAG: ABC transporter ATP-binding protein [Candidatus Hatepunaea meridiana]|nr:ABC transporter ATP-binding protein [Candidatus Hatepunaea meridiana]
MLTVNHINYRYPGINSNAIDNIDCSLNRGDIVGLIGLSASGKSTFGRLLKGLIIPASGKFTLQSNDNSSVELDSKSLIKTVGWVGSHPELQIFASSVKEEIKYGPTNQGLKGQKLADRVNWSLQVVGFNPNEILGRFPGKLSGGEKRRVALASVIAMKTPYYIFDDPTAGLDYAGQKCFISILRNLRDAGYGIIWITHNVLQLQSVINRLWGLEKGKMVLDVPADNVDWERIARVMETGKSL